MIVLLIALIIFSYTSIRNTSGKKSKASTGCPTPYAKNCPVVSCSPCPSPFAKNHRSVVDDKKQIEVANSALRGLPISSPSSTNTRVTSDTLGTLSLDTKETFDWSTISDSWNTVKNIFDNPADAFKQLLKDFLNDLVKRGDLQNISLSSIPTVPLEGTGYSLQLDNITIAKPTDNYVLNIDVDNLLSPSIGLLELTYNNLTFKYTVKLPNVGITSSIVDENDKVLMSTVLIFDIDIDFECSSNCMIRFKSESKANELFGITLSAPEFSLLFTQPSFDLKSSTFNLVSAHTVENNIHPCPSPYKPSMGGVMCSPPSDIDAGECGQNESDCRSYTHFFTPKSAKPCNSLCSGTGKNVYQDKTYPECPWKDDKSPLSSGASCKWDTCPEGFDASASTCIVKDKTEWAKEKLLFKALGLSDGDYTKESAISKLEDYLTKKLDLKHVIASKIEQYITNIDYNKVYTVVDSNTVSTKLVYVVSIKITN